MLRAVLTSLPCTHPHAYSWRPTAVRSFASSTLTGEPLLKSILKDKFPEAVSIEVEDISGGCGAMYNVSVETSEFSGLSTIKQHRLVTEALKAQIKEMHGVRINTKIAK